MIDKKTNFRIYLNLPAAYIIMSLAIKIRKHLLTKKEIPAVMAAGILLRGLVVITVPV